MKLFQLTSVASAALLLAACGGGSGDSDEPTVPPAPARGALLEPAATLVTLTAAQINAATAESGLQALSGTAKCDVKVVALNYATVGAKGESGANASGVMLVPTGATGSACASAAPLVAYTRGTEVQKLRTLANPQDDETFLLIAMYAAQGYAVVATDYLGYAKSTYTYHPYLHADSEATAAIDSVRAARNAAQTVGASLSGKVMFTGYSQGGHASMAAQRMAERDHGSEFNVVAGAHLAGPYNMAASVRATDMVLGVQFFLPMLITGWQQVYGNLYSDVKKVFKSPYDAYIETLLPTATDTMATLLSSGKLPGATGTPNQARDALIQPAYQQDLLTNDANGFYQAAVKNTLLGWTPKAPVLLCGGAGDPTVPPAMHQIAMKADFDKRGVANVTSVDVDAAIQATYGPDGKAPTDPLSPEFSAYYGNYHASYEPPLCTAYARGLFDKVR